MSSPCTQKRSNVWELQVCEALETLQVLGDLEDVNESDLSAINTLRNNSTFKNTMITTYDYDPLIGISVMKDARGRSTSYEYDAFGRLKLIKDHDGKLLEEYKYHYKGE